MYIKFNGSEEIFEIKSIQNIKKTLVIIKGINLPENNMNGFQFIINEEEKDYSDYKYIFNVITKFENVIMLSNNEEFIETEDNPAGRYYCEPDPNEVQEIIEDPLTNEELTEAVANLMYEISILQLGMEV